MTFQNLTKQFPYLLVIIAIFNDYRLTIKFKLLKKCLRMLFKSNHMKLFMTLRCVSGPEVPSQVLFGRGLQEQEEEVPLRWGMRHVLYQTRLVLHFHLLMFCQQ